MTIFSRELSFLTGIGLTLLLAQTADGASSIADSSSIRHPQPTPYGILLAAEDEGSLVLRNGESIRAVASGRGCGRYAAVSPDGERVGFKRIESDGRQTPCLLDLRNGTSLPLSSPSDQAGEVSFTTDGAIAFTRGTTLVVQRTSGNALYDLGSYANLAPISPDGQRVVFNDPDDQLWLLRLSTGTKTKITEGTAGFFCPRWSPDGTSVLYSSLGGDLFIHRIAGALTISLGQGDDPTWSPDSRHIIFSRRVFWWPRLIMELLPALLSRPTSSRPSRFSLRTAVQSSFDRTIVTRCSVPISRTRDPRSVRRASHSPRRHRRSLSPYRTPLPRKRRP
jgi:hypothetical protein